MYKKNIKNKAYSSCLAAGEINKKKTKQKQ